MDDHGASPSGRRSLRSRMAPFRTDVADLDYGVLKATIGYAIRATQLAVNEDHFRSVPREFHGGRMAAMAVIGANEGLRQGELAEILGLANSEVVGMIDVLEAMEMVSRRPVPTDRRAYGLVLTPRGNLQLEEFKRQAAEHERRICQRLAPGEREELISLLHRIRESDPNH